MKVRRMKNQRYHLGKDKKLINLKEVQKIKTKDLFFQMKKLMKKNSKNVSIFIYTINVFRFSKPLETERI